MIVEALRAALFAWLVIGWFCLLAGMVSLGLVLIGALFAKLAEDDEWPPGPPRNKRVGFEVRKDGRVYEVREKVEKGKKP